MGSQRVGHNWETFTSFFLDVCRAESLGFRLSLNAIPSNKPFLCHPTSVGPYDSLSHHPNSLSSQHSSLWLSSCIFLPLFIDYVPSHFSCVQNFVILSSDQFSCSVVSDSLRPHESQHTRPPCPSPTPGVHPNPCPSIRWCHPAISSSVIPFSSCPQSLPVSGSFPVSQLFSWGGQSIRVSASISVLPMNTQDLSPLGWTGWISLLSKGLSRVFSNITVQKHQLFSAQLSSPSSSHIHTWPLEKPEPWPDRRLLAK